MLDSRSISVGPITGCVHSVVYLCKALGKQVSRRSDKYLGLGRQGRVGGVDWMERFILGWTEQAMPLLHPGSPTEINPSGVSHSGQIAPFTEILFFFKCYFYFSFFQVKKLEVDKEKLEKKNEEIASKLACICSRSNARSDWLTLGHCSPVMSTG